MGSFIIEGGRPLKGQVSIQGSKNAALPILAAALLTPEKCVIERVPRIEDVFRMIELIKSLGVRVFWENETTVSICAAHLSPDTLDQELVGRFRASVLVVGPLLGRCGKLQFVEPGGCQIGARSLQTHLRGLAALGVKVKNGAVRLGTGERRVTVSSYHFDAAAVRPADVVLDEFSVTATENILLAAAAVAGATTIQLAAAEPHVQDLCRALTMMGASVWGIGTHTLRITGAKTLKGFKVRLSPDMLDMGTFLVAAAATHGHILLKGVVREHCVSVCQKAEMMGIRLKFLSSGGPSEEHDLMVDAPRPLKAVRIQTMPFPGFPTDLQALFGLLATQARGTSLIHDTLYEGRLKYLDELAKMGAQTFVADPHRAIVAGPTTLVGREIQTFDIRAGATLVIAGLVAKGRTILRNSYQVDRGYERIDERLRQLGASIRRTNV